MASCAATFFLLTLIGMGLFRAGQRPYPEGLSLAEAEILIYLLPEAHKLRNQGMDIGWELEKGPGFNSQDFYNFWIVNAKRKGVDGSVTIGFFSVNKHTADVWDDALERFVASAELKGVQTILRRAHGVNEATIKKYRSQRPRVPIPRGN